MKQLDKALTNIMRAIYLSPNNSLYKKEESELVREITRLKDKIPETKSPSSSPSGSPYQDFISFQMRSSQGDLLDEEPFFIEDKIADRSIPSPSSQITEKEKQLKRKEEELQRRERELEAKIKSLENKIKNENENNNKQKNTMNSYRIAICASKDSGIKVAFDLVKCKPSWVSDIVDIFTCKDLKVDSSFKEQTRKDLFR